MQSQEKSAPQQFSNNYDQKPEETNAPKPQLSRQEALEKLINELETQYTRERLQENNYLVERLMPNLEISFHILAKENKVKAITEDYSLIKEVLQLIFSTVN